MPAGFSTTRSVPAMDAAAPIGTEAVHGSVRIIVFNDHPVFRSSLSWKVAPESGIELVADTASLSETLNLVAEQPEGFVDAVVADLRIGDGNSEGVESVKTLANMLGGVPVVVYSDQFSRSFATRMNEAGAASMVRKSTEAGSLIAAIHDAVESTDDVAEQGTEHTAA